MTHPPIPSVRRLAQVFGTTPGTIQRWKTTRPLIYAALVEYEQRRSV